MAFDPNDPRVQEFLRGEEPQKPEGKKKPKRGKEPDGEYAPKRAENRVRRPFQKTRANVPLSRQEVRAIKKGRRKLRRELRQRGIRSKREFELTAGTLGLYFDRNSNFAAWFRLHWLGALLGTLAAMLGIVLFLSVIVQVRGYFTINLSNGMFREGFTLSDTSGFEYPTTQLLAIPAEGVPCISINQIPEDVDDTDGEHNENYMAYTFYIRNEGENTVSFNWRLCMSAESQNASEAVWSILFVDGVPRVYAKPASNGSKQSLPAYGDDTRGYTRIPVLMANDSDQFHLITSRGGVDFYRVVPDMFPTADVMAEGHHDGVVPGEIHKYTVVLWIEGDDPECTDDLIGAYLGARMDFQLAGQDYDDRDSGGLGSKLQDLWESLKY